MSDTPLCYYVTKKKLAQDQKAFRHACTKARGLNFNYSQALLLTLTKRIRRCKNRKYIVLTPLYLTLLLIPQNDKILMMSILGLMHFPWITRVKFKGYFWLKLKCTRGSIFIDLGN